MPAGTMLRMARSLEVVRNASWTAGGDPGAAPGVLEATRGDRMTACNKPVVRLGSLGTARSLLGRGCRSALTLKSRLPLLDSLWPSLSLVHAQDLFPHFGETAFNVASRHKGGCISSQRRLRFVPSALLRQREAQGSVGFACPWVVSTKVLRVEGNGFSCGRLGLSKTS